MRGIGDLLNKLQGVKKAGDGFLARCPAHEDKRQSLSVGLNHEKLLVNCHAGCTTEAVMAALRLTVKDLFLDSATPATGPARIAAPPAPEKLVCTYDYTDAAGTLLYQVCRFEPKGFRQRRPDGKGGWLWDMNGIERVLYRLPAVMASETVYLVEGEKDADSLSALGLVATTSPGGASAWRPEYAQVLKGKQVIIIPDRDEAGVKYAKAAAASLWNVAREVEVILLAQPAKDASDYLAAGGDLAALLASAQPIGALYGDDRPEVVETVAGRSFTWGQYGVRVEVTHLHQHQDGKTTGKLTIWRINQPTSRPLHSAQFNFSSGPTRDRLASSLNSKPAGAGVDWSEMVEGLCQAVEDWAREGEPVRTLMSGGELREIEYLLEPIWPRDQTTIIFGERGNLKSQLALLMGLTVGLPWDDNPLGLRPVYARGLYLDWESEHYLMERRINRLRAGMGIDGEVGIEYRRCFGPLARDIEGITAAIAQVKAEYIIIDSIGLAVGGDLTAAEPVIEFFANLRRLKVSVLALAHTARNTEVKSVYGSVFFENLARCIWECKSDGEPGGDDFRLGLFNTKANETKTSAPIGFQVHFDGLAGPVTFERDDEGLKDSTMAPRLPASILIKAALGHGAMTAAEIQDATGLKDATIRGTLKRLRDNNIIVKLASEKWGLRQ